MDQKQIFYYLSTSPFTRYRSFIRKKNRESYNWCGINELPRRQIRGCFHGWVILSDHSVDILFWFLWNPLTSNLIHLPPLNRKEEEEEEEEEEEDYDDDDDDDDFPYFCLSSPPSDQGSVFLLLSHTTPTIVLCRLDCKSKGGLKWIEMSYAEQLQSISGMDGVQLACPTCYNGKVYALTRRKESDYQFVIQLDIEVKAMEVVISLLQFVKIPQAYTHFSTRNSDCFTYPFLKGSCTELFYIVVCLKDDKRIGMVSLFKLNTTSIVFEEMESLEDAIFFVKLSTSSVFYKSRVASDIRGYVHVLDHMNKIMYSFDVEDRTMSLSLTSCTLRESQLLVWAMLECRLEVDYCKSKQEEKDKDVETVIRQVKPDETKSDSESESHLLNVLFHILEMIMERCVGVEYMRFRATCKLCCLAAPPIQWGNERTLRKWQTYSVVSPWLMVLDNYGGIITFNFIDPICGDEYFILKPRELTNDCQICYSMYGWLLLLDRFNMELPQMWFFNPFTSEVIQLSIMPDDFRSICFSAPPTSPDCTLIGFTRQRAYVCPVYHEAPWRLYDLDTGISDVNSFPIPTFSGRDMYVLCNNARIEAFRNIGKENFSRVVVVDKVPVSRCTSLKEYFLANYDSHLLLVIVGEVEESVEVFKLNESTKEWEEINCLGTHMVYISYPSCFCLEARLPEMANKIYFSRLLHNDDTKTVFYSMETCKYHTFDDKNIQESFGVYLSETVRHCYYPHTWIEPSWS
ncbi:uncharacterized protein LOC143614059 [Bidens hawaiensis]|uniref:uncharacterized protein LOC143614059 n=1 Tax=Bidens hawaiensis TaxID=980011 RepID=UPI00404AD0E8